MRCYPHYWLPYTSCNISYYFSPFNNALSTKRSYFYCYCNKALYNDSALLVIAKVTYLHFTMYAKKYFQINKRITHFRTTKTMWNQNYLVVEFSSMKEMFSGTLEVTFWLVKPFMYHFWNSLWWGCITNRINNTQGWTINWPF